MVYYPPMEELLCLYNFVTKGTSPVFPIREACLKILAYSKTRLPLGLSLPPLSKLHSKDNLLIEIAFARDGKDHGWINLILPVLKILEQSFLCSDTLSCPYESLEPENTPGLLPAVQA